MSCSCISNPCIQFTEALTSCGLWRWPAYVKITSICLGPHGESRRLGRRQWHRQTIETLGGCPAFRPLAKESARCERLPCFALPRSHGAEIAGLFRSMTAVTSKTCQRRDLSAVLAFAGKLGRKYMVYQRLPLCTCLCSTAQCRFRFRGYIEKVQDRQLARAQGDKPQGL